MPTIQQTIPLNLIRHLQLTTFSNTTGQPTNDPLVPLASPNSAIASASVNTLDPSVIDITPGTMAGVVTLVVNKTPPCPDPLSIQVTITAPANIGSVGFVAVAGPDTPKP